MAVVAKPNRVRAWALACAVFGCTVRFAGTRATLGSWAVAALLLVVAFPLHLVFEIPAALAGRP
ncbi:hypothetical protein ACIA47_03655 [Micromonospora sp. NPDC051227]|uniref:hypothetical protein n=1 Tax=Micromonospora sp. NPDC051227 TaxID=3364285 RepID=UPI0037B53CA1